MAYFMVEGILRDTKKMNDVIMREHMAYTQRAMDGGMIVLSGLKIDETGGIFIMKAESAEEVDGYLAGEPFQAHGIQEYRYIEFAPHFMEWK